MNLLSFDAYFFDFDGLLADTEPLHYKAYQLLLEKRGLTLPWDFTTYCHYAHQKTEVFASHMFSLFPVLKEEQPDWMILREEKQNIYQDLITSHPVSLMPGALALIVFLHTHHKSMYVVTNATQRQIDAIKHNKPFLNIIPTWVTREQYAHPKPAPDCYLKAMELHGNQKCKGIGFEDAPRGIEALKAARLTPVLILPSNYPQPDSKITEGALVFHSLTELLASHSFSQL